MEEPGQRETNTTKCQKEKCDYLFYGNFDDLLFSKHLAVWNYTNTKVAPFFPEKNGKSWLTFSPVASPALNKYQNVSDSCLAIHMKEE